MLYNYHLPEELWGEILEKLIFPTEVVFPEYAFDADRFRSSSIAFASLCQVSKEWYARACPLLYKTIYNDFERPDSLLSLLQTLNQQPSLAKYVRNVRFLYNCYPWVLLPDISCDEAITSRGYEEGQPSLGEKPSELETLNDELIRPQTYTQQAKLSILLLNQVAKQELTIALQYAGVGEPDPIRAILQLKRIRMLSVSGLQTVDLSRSFQLWEDMPKLTVDALTMQNVDLYVVRKLLLATRVLRRIRCVASSPQEVEELRDIFHAFSLDNLEIEISL